MYVRVILGAVTVEEPDDCTSLAVRAPNIPEDVVDKEIAGAGLGRSRGGHAELDVERLRAMASSAATRPDWHDGFDEMLAYAARRGWLSADGRRVVAHVDLG
jgi:hypothetical protein